MRQSVRLVLVATVIVVGVVSLIAGLGLLALSIDDGGQPSGTESDGVLTTDVRTLHEAGVTGENVTVGVLDVTGYDLTHGTYTDQVAGTRQFGADATPVDAGDGHGTATAATVARVAPGADIYLATFDSPADYERALEWLSARDVDVVVAPVAQAGTVGDGTTPLSRATTAAVDDGLVVVTPTGNIASGHWLGEYRPTDGGVHRFENGTLNRLDGNASRGEFWLAWDAPDENYTLELHRLGDDGTELLARSVQYSNGSVPSERLTAQLQPGETYALVVRGPMSATGTTVRVATPTHRLVSSHPRGSLTAPGAAPGALAVGAVDPVTDELEPFSSRGPSLDGRIGVDVVAPNRQPVPGTDEVFVGTSSSAAVTGGVVALLFDVDPTLSPREVRFRLGATATGGPTASPATGHGTIDPIAAVTDGGGVSALNETAV